jgi:hypothetical protein
MKSMKWGMDVVNHLKYKIRSVGLNIETILFI